MIIRINRVPSPPSRRTVRVGAVAVVIAAASHMAGPAHGATVMAGAGATIHVPLTITQTQGLDFGTVTSGAAGSVALDAGNGSRNVAGGVGLVARDAGAPGTFAVTGQSDAAITVAVGPAITGMAGGITGVTSVSAVPTVLVGTSATLQIGGSLTIPANAPPGTYTGTYTIAVDYQ